ncbi:MAG: glycosyltransferase family 2 protein [Pseudomonadota bacterium]
MCDPDSPVKVVIVNFNAGAVLADCLRCVLASSVPVDVVVVDNASTDDSLDLLPAVVDKIRVIRNDSNLGFSAANNQVLRACSGDFALLLNPDCLVAPDTLEQVRSVMRADASLGMAGCLLLNTDGSEQNGGRRLAPTPTRVLWAMFPGQRLTQAGQPLPSRPQYVEALSGAFMMVRVEAMRSVGLLDEAYFMHWEDLDWCERFRRAGWQLSFVPGAVAVHQKGVCSRHRPIRMEWFKHRGMVRYLFKFYYGKTRLAILLLITLGVTLRFLVKTAAIVLGRKRA